MPELNDVHSKLNRTAVLRVETPRTVAEAQAVMARARAESIPLIAAGGRHAMGGQQLVQEGVVVDTRGTES